MTLLELFSGIGGFAKGFKDAGDHFTKHYFSEIDKHAIACYKYNFKDAEHIGSVTDVRGGNIPRPNIITFGSPCQDFSLAGKQRGLAGDRSSLIIEAIRIIGECRPDIFIWENVKGAFSSNNGADFWAIINAFTHIGGYRLEWQLLNTSWVLPQNRERIYLIGHLAERSTPSVFPITESDFRAIEGATNPTIVRAITAGGHSGGHHSGMTLVKQVNNKKEGEKFIPQQNRIFSIEGDMTCLHQDARNHILVKTLQGNDTINTIRSGGRGSFTNKHNWDIIKVGKVSRTDAAKEIRRESMKNGVDYTPFQGKKLEFFESDIMNTITCATMKDNTIEQNEHIRRLTEIECERLQGFPDDWTKWGNYNGTIKEIVKTQRYKMCGNAVTVKIVELIANRLKINNP